MEPLDTTLNKHHTNGDLFIDVLLSIQNSPKKKKKILVIMKHHDITIMKRHSKCLRIWMQDASAYINKLCTHCHGNQAI